MWVYFLKVTFCRLRKVQMLFASEMREEIALVSESDRTGLLGSSIKNTTDETLFLELTLRGYDLSKLRDENETTGEVVKIS